MGDGRELGDGLDDLDTGVKQDPGDCKARFMKLVDKGDVGVTTSQVP